MANATRFRFRLITALLLGTASLSAQAKAQEVAAPTPSPADQVAPAKEEEIIVTAQRREQQLTRVGINITALSARAIEETRITQIENIAAAIPNAEFIVIPNSGHMTTMENPVAVNNALRAFIESLA